MKPGALLVNTSRGGIIDEPALAAALADGRLGGAGIDVFEKEPPAADNPLLAAPRAILTPHAAALTRECTVRMAVLAVERVLDQFAGRIPDNVANPDVLTLERWRSCVLSRRSFRDMTAHPSRVQFSRLSKEYPRSLLSL